MLNVFKRKPGFAAAAATKPTRADLQIRSLLDNPDLRRAMGLGVVAAIAPNAPNVLEPRYEVHRLLDAVAA